MWKNKCSTLQCTTVSTKCQDIVLTIFIIDYWHCSCICKACATLSPCKSCASSLGMVLAWAWQRLSSVVYYSVSCANYLWQGAVAVTVAPLAYRSMRIHYLLCDVPCEGQVGVRLCLVCCGAVCPCDGCAVCCYLRTQKYNRFSLSFSML